MSNNETLSPMAELLGKAAYHLSAAQPLLPMYAHLIVSALFPIYTGAHASLTRPSSAAKPPTKPISKTTTSGVEGEDEEDVRKMEGLSPKDAILFPLLAGSTLVGLYLLITYAGAEVLNRVLGWYFSGIGVFSVEKLINDGLKVVYSFMWPTYYADQGRLWRVDAGRHLAVSEGVPHDAETRTSPLPGTLSRFPLPPFTTRLLWRARELPKQRWVLSTHIYRTFDLTARFDLIYVFSSILAIAAIVYGNLVRMPWWLTNLQGFAVCYSALQFLSPTTFGTGSLILAALFVYDIYFVFFTPMMVTVAKSLDVPIKLLFPRPEEPGHTADELPRQSFGMLGLGDIVLPGIMIGLALRFDLHLHYLRKQTRLPKNTMSSDNPSNIDDFTIDKAKYVSAVGRWGDVFWARLGLSGSDSSATVSAELYERLKASEFPKAYFTASLVGYVAGLLATLGVMSVYQHAQPALLYLVPGVLSSLWGTALARGEIRMMWEFSEEVEEDEAVKKKDDVDEARSEKWWEKLSTSMFGHKTSTKTVKDEDPKRETETSIQPATDADYESNSTGSVKESAEEKKASSNAVLFSFSITPERALPVSLAVMPATGNRSVEVAALDAEIEADDEALARAVKKGGIVTERDPHSPTSSRTPSEPSSDDAVLVGSADPESATEQKPVWRGSSTSSGVGLGEDKRPGKRVRVG